MTIDRLTGGDDPQDVAGIAVVAPGVLGAAESLGPDPELLTPGARLLHSALANSGLYATTHVAITHSTAASGDVTVTVPAPRPGYNSLLLVHDSTGALSWHTSTGITARSSEAVPDRFRSTAPPLGADTPATVSFTVPMRRFAADVEHVSLWSRIVGLVEHFAFHPSLQGARKLLSVVEYPVEHLVGKLGSEWFTEWEDNKHPNVIRWFPPESGLRVGEPLSPTNWHELAEGPTLLFVHGIFSSCESGFSGISDDEATWATLRERYDNRIIAFDHPTASVTPAANAAWFLAQLPNVHLDLDIVCHSRGGLVARSLAEQAAAWDDRTERSVDVGRIVFAATPNGGSQITVPGKWEALINRISSALTLPAKALPAPADVIAGVLAGLLEVIKIVGVGVALDLPGLEDMNPASEFLRTLGRTSAHLPPTYFAAAADFEPGHLLATLFDRLDDLGRVVDAEIFGAGVRNDIAVPTEGVWNPTSVLAPASAATGSGTVTDDAIPGFPIDVANRLPIGPGSIYWHCDYFDDPKMRDALLRWLPGRPMVDRT